MTEAELQAELEKLLRRYCWLYFHPYSMRRSSPGWPDLFAVKGERALALECKTEHGRLREGQQEWVDALGRVLGITALIVRPRDLQRVADLIAA